MSDSYVLDVTSSATSRGWMFRHENERLTQALAQQPGISDVLARILASREVLPDDAEGYLEPTLRDLLPDPLSFRDMERAVERIVQALQNEEKIGVFGDYDVDGATSSALIKRYFRWLDKDIFVHIPDRMKEGYGPNASALLNMKAKGVALILTVDCGISSFDPLATAAEAGIDVIVVDHHQAGASLPVAAAIVNPNRLDDQSGQGHMAAVGVTFMLLIALNSRLRQEGWFEAVNRAEPNLITLLDIVALGTVCDVVPLRGVNRAFVRQGLKIMARRDNQGLAALSDVSGVNETIGTYHLGFLLGPRVNAGGRVGESSLGTQLLSLDNYMEAEGIAERLDRYNRERQAIEALVLEQATEQIERRYGHEPPAAIWAASEHWHQGVVGIVASRIKDRYQRPTFIAGVNSEGKATASGRSIAGIDLGAIVNAAVQAGLAEKGGGHAMAAGLTADLNRLEELEDFLRDRASSGLKNLGPSNLNIDAVVSANGATIDLIEEFERAGPFGAGSPEPRIVVPEVEIISPKLIGADKSHVSFKAKPRQGSWLNCVAFRCADKALGQALLSNPSGRQAHVAGKLRKNQWQGRVSVQLLVDDVTFL